MRTPSSALPACPHGLLEGRGRPLDTAFLAAGFFDFSLTTFRVAALDFAFTFDFLAFFVLMVVPVACMPLVYWCSARIRRAYFLRILLCGLRLPIRPLSLPAARPSTGLMRVGLAESIAAFTARLSSSGDVALTPTPPKASIILS